MIAVKDLHARDQISIRTQNSEYQFQVIEPTQCRGILTGGLCGEEQYEAVLSGVVPGDHWQGRVSANLEVGTCALFYITAKESLKSLTTSVITNLEIGCDVI
jgi:hypothetical protein